MGMAFGKKWVELSKKPSPTGLRERHGPTLTSRVIFSKASGKPFSFPVF